MVVPFLLLQLLATVTGYTSFLQTYRFPQTAVSSGVHYIHSPEYFLKAHGLCGAGFSLLGTIPPVMCGEHAFTVMSYRTHFDGRMEARVFTNDGNRSHFMLMDHKGRPCVMGHLRLLPLGPSGGFALRCFASRMRPLGFWDMMLGSPSPGKEFVERTIVQSCNAMFEDENLRKYRRMVLGLPGPHGITTRG